MKTMPWYRVPEVWLLIFLVAGGVGGGITLAGIAMGLPDGYIADADTQGHKLPQ